MNNFIVSCGISLLTNYGKTSETPAREEKGLLCSFIRDTGWRHSCAEEIADYLMSEGYMMVFVERVEGLTRSRRESLAFQAGMRGALC